MQNLANSTPEQFSLTARNKILSPVRDSTQKTYDSYFRGFTKFIRDRNGNSPFPLSEIIEYFNYLSEKNLNHKTLLGHRTMLREILQEYFDDYDIVNDKYIRKIIQYTKSKTSKRFNFPSWDLDKVVLMLKESEDSSPLHFFHKVFFICALACPMRISEFSSICISNSTFTPSRCVLRTHPSFLSKNQTDDYTPQDFIMPLNQNCRELCPVTLVNSYLEYTNKLCRERAINRLDRFWLDEKLKPLTVIKMRKWFRDIVFKADPNTKLKGTNFHSVRKQVSTQLLFRGHTIQNILSRMNWKSNSTFRSFYALLGVQSSVDAVLAGHIQ